MKSLQEFQKKEKKLLMPTYARYPLAIERGDGYFLYDFEGKRYYDFLAGIAVCILGHNHPAINQTLARQSQKLIHVSNLFFQEEQLILAEKLQKYSGQRKIFFCNSGAEANEGAIKLVRRYFQRIKKEERYEIITFSNSFHGRTLATLTATGQDKVKDGFAPLPAGFKTIPFNEVQALEEHCTSKTAAIMLEVIQGEGGVNPLSPEFALQIKEICKQKDLLLIIDEVQTGIGRTGKFWAHEHFALEPDIITTAKGLGGGLPIGAVLAKEEVAQAFTPGSHGTTFGGNALACAVSTTVLEVLERENLVENTQKLGDYFYIKGESLLQKYPQKIKNIKGKGLMLGIELQEEGKKIWQSLLNKGFITNLTQDKILRLLPPLTIDQKAVDAFFLALEESFKE